MKNQKQVGLQRSGFSCNLILMIGTILLIALSSCEHKDPPYTNIYTPYCNVIIVIKMKYLN